MLTRLANLVLAVSLLAPLGAARAESSANAPHPAPVAEPMPMRGPPARAEVRAALAKRRDKNLASFGAYRDRGIYPHNTERPGPLNVWRDADNHFCAAATILLYDGKGALVQQIAAEQNHIRLLDVTDGELMDWMLTSGLTVEEIDRIQAPAMMPTPKPRALTPAEKREQAKREREDAELRTGYAATGAYLVKHATADLEVATDRLMANPALAWTLLEPAGPAPAGV